MGQQGYNQRQTTKRGLDHFRKRILPLKKSVDTHKKMEADQNQRLQRLIKHLEETTKKKKTMDCDKRPYHGKKACFTTAVLRRSRAIIIPLKKKKEAETQESKVGMDTLAFVKSRKSGFPVSLFRFSLVEVKNEISCFTEDVVFIFFFEV